MIHALLAPLVLALPTLGPFADETREKGGAQHLEAIAALPLLELDGRQVRLEELAGEGPLVLTWTGVGCPISGKYAPRLARLARAYGERGVRFLGVNASPQDGRADVAEEQEELELGFTVLKDFRQALTRALDVRTTTEVFVFDDGGALRYRGAVDDQYSLGAARPEPRENWLRDALDAVLAKRVPATRATDAPGCAITRLPEHELPEAITWSRDVAPILRSNCEVCHRPGQVGPFGLQTYEQARGWAAMIDEVVAERRMPPWNAAERFDGHFANERRLTEGERAKIARWVADGMPQGDPSEAPPPAHWPEGWRIGDPDAVFAMERWFFSGEELPEEGYAVPREGTVEYQYFAVDTDFPEDRWIQALEILPGAADVVHHVLIGAWDRTQGAFDDDDLLNYLAVAVPGDTPSVYPEGYAKRLPAGSTLVFQLHYTPNGKERFDRSRLALTFTQEPPIFEVVSEPILEQTFEIPAGADDYEVRRTIDLVEDTGVISFFPHMHRRGKDFQYIAHYPDGTSEELLYADYDFNWQETYIYEDPLLLPSGTKIECVAHYDNSAANPNNPDPTATVQWGDQSWEEMFVGFFDRVVPVDS